MRRATFFAWSLIACPLLGLASAATVDTGSEAGATVVLVGVPIALAVLGGVALQRPRTVVVLTALASAVVTVLALFGLVVYVFRVAALT